MPRFSVITICFNDAVGLASTIQSVGPQTFSDFEYLVQDGDSQDETKEIVNGYHDWVDIFNSEPDEGIYDAMNRGVASATGDYTLFLNSSDIFLDCNTLEQLDQNLLEGDEIVHGMAIDIDTGLVHEYKPLNDYKYGMVFDHQATVVKTDILRKLQFDTSLQVAGDLDFFCRCRNEGVRIRQIDLDIAKKSFLIGASTDYLTRFRERSSVLIRNFPDSAEEISMRLKTELLEYTQSQFGSESLTDRLRNEPIKTILTNIDELNHQLCGTLD